MLLPACSFLLCSITSVADSLQQWPWVPYQHIPFSQFSSLSGGRIDVFSAFFSVSACSSDLLSLQRDSVNISVALCIVKMLTLKSTNQLRLTPSTNYIRLITMQCSAVRPWVLSSMWLFLRKVSTT